MPESHINFQGLGTGKPKKVRRKSAPSRPSPESGSAGKTRGQRRQTSPQRYRQIQKSKPQRKIKAKGRVNAAPTRKSATTAGPPLVPLATAHPFGVTLHPSLPHIPHAAEAPALAILEQTTRPLHAIAAPINAALKGKGWKAQQRAAVRGAQNKDKSTFSDVLKTAGVPKSIKGFPVRAVAGTALDIVGDPTTYATFGVGGVAKGGLEKGAAAVAAHELEHGKPLTAGMRFHVPGTNQTKVVRARVPGTAKAEKATRKARLKIREDTPGVSRVIQATGKALNPHFRPKGISPTEHAAVRQAGFDLRAAQTAGTTKYARRAHAYQAAVKDAAESTGQKEHQVHRQVIDALESQSPTEKAISRHNRNVFRQKGKGKAKVVGHQGEPSGITLLPKELQEPARSLHQDLAAFGEGEFSRGLLKARRSHYFPHVGQEKLEPVKAGEPVPKLTSSSLLDASHARKDLRTHAVKRGEGLVSEDVPAVFSHRAGQHVAATSRSDYWRQVAEQAGRKLTPKTHVNLGDGDMVYQLTPRGLRPVKTGRGGIDLKKIRKALGPDAKGEFFVINHQAVSQAEDQVKHMGRSERTLFSSAQAKVKYLQTAPNPGYHLNNVMGDTLMGRQGGAVSRDMIDAVKASRVRKTQAKFQKSAGAVTGDAAPVSGKKIAGKPVEHWISEAENAGVLDTGFQAGELTGNLLREGKGHGRLARFSQARENLPRMASFIGARKRGMSIEEAAAHVRNHHFDYGDLTEFEKNTARKVIPFYTFQARNTKLQAKQILKRPGNFATYEKTREETAKQFGLSVDEFDRLLSTFELRGAPIAGPGSTNIYPKAPLIQGLQQVTLSPKAQIQNLVNSSSVLLKVPIELVQGRNWFFNEDIVDPKHPRIPAPALAVATQHERDVISAISKRFGMKDVQKIIDPKTGRLVWGWDPRLTFLAQQLPQTNTATTLLTPGGNQHGVDQKLGAVSYLTGIKVGRRSESKTKLNKLYDPEKQIQGQMDDLHQQGKDRDNQSFATPEREKLGAKMKTVKKQIEDARKQAGYPNRPPRLKHKGKTGRRGGGGGGYGSSGSSGGYGS